MRQEQGHRQSLVQATFERGRDGTGRPAGGGAAFLNAGCAILRSLCPGMQKAVTPRSCTPPPGATSGASPALSALSASLGGPASTLEEDVKRLQRKAQGWKVSEEPRPPGIRLLLPHGGPYPA